MVTNESISQKFQAIKEVSYVQVEGDGYHYHLTLVSDIFQGKSKVQRQQWVYAQLKDIITSGKLHAINMKTWTKSEWETQGG